MTAPVRRACLVTATLLPLLLATCTPVRNPATGELQYTMLTPEEEQAIGKLEHPKVLRAFGGEYADPALRAYVQEIGERMVAVSELADQKFTFTLLDSSEANAFALPGGYVYVTRGMLALADDEAELAGVIGHEIGHITARHTAQRYDRAMLGQIGVFGLVILGAVLAGDAGAQLAQHVGNLGAIAWVQGFSREQEFEADQLGVRYLVRAGYDPMAMASLIDAFDAWDHYREKLTGRSASDIPSWLASHPRARDRVREVAQKAGRRGAAGRRERESYLARINGMVFGNSPRQGWAEGRRFVHPELGFTFEVPEGFRTENQPDAVLARGPGGEVLLAGVTELPSGQSLADYLLRDLLQGRATGRPDRRRSRGGFEVVRAPFQARYEGRPVEGVAAVLHDGSKLWRFLVLAPDFSQRLVSHLEQTINSFRRLDAEELDRYRPQRIEVVTVRPGDTIASLAARMEVDQGAEELLRALNDLRGPNDLQPGRQIKLVRRY